MIRIKFEQKFFSIKILLYLTIAILIYIFTSEIVFSKELSKNIKYNNSPEEELAIKYCDSTKKNIFVGLNKETILKYEYYFSNLKKPYSNEPEKFFKDFKIYVIKNCSYKLTEIETEEFKTYINRFLKLKIK